MVETVEEERYPSLPPIQTKSFHQFIKFCIIGFSSTIVDMGLMNLFIRLFGLPWMIAKTISFLFSATNGFIWNSLWTFRGMGSSKRHHQYVKFVAINVVGLVLSICIMKIVITLIGSVTHSSHQQTMHVNIAFLVAVVFVSIWNFLANKKWTFN
jgi:putative flippase GtrA